MRHRCHRSKLLGWFPLRHLRPGARLLLMPNPGEVILFPDCPCCGSSSSSGHSSSGSSSSGDGCPGCPPVTSALVTFTVISGTLFPGGFSTRTLVYNPGSDSWFMSYSFFGTISVSFVCRSSACLVLAGVATSTPGCNSVASTLTPSNGMALVLTGPGCATYHVEVSW